MTLSYLDFDYSEDTAGSGSFDAMASVVPSRLPDLMAEVERVLAWAHREFGAPGLEDEAQWDCELQGVQEVSTALDVSYDAQSDKLSVQPGSQPGEPRTTLSLTLSGSSAFAAAFRHAFLPGD